MVIIKLLMPFSQILRKSDDIRNLICNKTGIAIRTYQKLVFPTQF